MFSSVGWGELVVLGVVALVVLGPERLPQAASWVAGAIKSVKNFAGTAQQQLKDDFGTDFDDFREPLAELNKLRGLSPRALVTTHLLDGDDSMLTGKFGSPGAPTGAGSTTASEYRAPTQTDPATGAIKPSMGASSAYDSDAT